MTPSRFEDPWVASVVLKEMKGARRSVAEGFRMKDLDVGEPLPIMLK